MRKPTEKITREIQENEKVIKTKKKEDFIYKGYKISYSENLLYWFERNGERFSFFTIEGAKKSINFFERGDSK